MTRDPMCKPLSLNGDPPIAIAVRETTPEGHQTRLFALVLDYGYAERLIADRCYQTDANDLAVLLGAALGIPFALLYVVDPPPLR